MSTVTVDIDLGDIYFGLSDSGKQSLADWLADDGCIDSHDVDVKEYEKNYKKGGMFKREVGDLNDWKEVCARLSHAYYQMSNDEVEQVANLVRKYVV